MLGTYVTNVLKAQFYSIFFSLYRFTPPAQLVACTHVQPTYTYVKLKYKQVHLKCLGEKTVYSWVRFILPNNFSFFAIDDLAQNEPRFPRFNKKEEKKIEGEWDVKT